MTLHHLREKVPLHLLGLNKFKKNGNETKCKKSCSCCRKKISCRCNKSQAKRQIMAITKEGTHLSALFLFYKILSDLLFLYRSPIDKSVILKVEPGTFKDPFLFNNVTVNIPVYPFCSSPAVFYHFSIHPLPDFSGI